MQCALYKESYVFVIRRKLSYEYTLSCRLSYINGTHCMA